MYVIGNRRTRQGLTSTIDKRRVQLLMFGFEQHTARDDIGAREHYWYVGRLRMGQPHPYEAQARQLLDAERDALIAAVTPRLQRATH